MGPVKKENYLALIEGPYKHAFTVSNIKAGFKKTGVWPFNPSVITPAMMAPSIPNSVNALFPMPQSSPVRALAPLIKIATWNPPFLVHPPSSSPSVVQEATYETIQDISVAFQALDLGRDVYTTPPHIQNPLPLSNSPQEPPIAAIPDPPSSSIGHQAVEALKKTSLGAYLVGGGPIEEEITLPPPNLTVPVPPKWPYPPPAQSSIRMKHSELLAENKKLRDNLATAIAHIKVQDEIIRANNAQMTLQWLYVSKLDEARISASKKTRKTVFHGGKGVELTGDVFMGESQARYDAKVAEDAAKAAKTAQLTSAKALKAVQEAAWALETQNNALAVAEWNEKYAGMKPSLLKAVDAPKKPQRRRKAVVFQEAAVAFPTGGERADVPEASEVTRGEDFSSMIEGVGSSDDESEYHPYAEE